MMTTVTSRPKRSPKMIASTKFIFCMPDKMRKEINKICHSRGIELAEYVRESIAKNNNNYKKKKIK